MKWKAINHYEAHTDVGHYEIRLDTGVWQLRRNGRLIHVAGFLDDAKTQAQIDHDDRTRKTHRKNL